jgi:hypothetical protein
MWIVARIAGSLKLGGMIYYFALGLSCTLCMRIHPPERPPLSSLDIYAPCPHATSASVLVAVGRPRAADLGGVVWWVLKRSLYWRYRRLQGESNMLLGKLVWRLAFGKLAAYTNLLCSVIISLLNR